MAASTLFCTVCPLPSNSLVAKFHLISVYTLDGFHDIPVAICHFFYFVKADNVDACVAANKNKLLTWDKRKEIAQKVSLSLAFLHNLGMVYGNVNSSNVLLDHLGRASLTDVENSDSGLVEDSDSGVVGVEKYSSGSWGFMAPKQFYSGKTSKESDVYSFGVLLLELLTGKDPLTATSHLPKLIFSVKDERWPMELLDRELRSHVDIPNMWAMYRIAKQCTSLHEHSCPRMGQVVRMIENLSWMSNESTENGVFDEDWASLENEMPINDVYVDMLVNRPDLQDL